ncbi:MULTISPECIES: CHAP domain-containing protein [Pseudanabaena]|uniref:CHAP domain-containing protein n=1 Tax=Pseudanabaena TaxID=1152 RepID=UPI00247A0E6F|nr:MULTISPECIES: CHAP domain-containing protein [Pseudanabaena]MEA5489646.1 CHAP domain-containing protein [Pseudanabaena sp. CCNP1317]WGS75253.1 CHAP domain-containing protein [Pseudanabaena galeata CCNP1313]
MTILTKIKPSFKKTAVSSLLSLAAIVPSSVVLSQLFASPSEAASTCQCVGYVKNRFGITAAVGNAKDMIHSLPRHGFTRVNSPQPGAVVIMQPTFRGAHARYGHVGIVERTSVRNGSTFLTVRGSNQGGRWFSEFNCTNVAIVDFATPVNGRSDVSYWVRGNVSRPPSNPIRSVRFSGTSASGGINVRSGPGTNFGVVRRIGGNQRINFDAWQYGTTERDLWMRTPDARWYRISGTNQWVASAVVFGNAPNSRPMP